MDVKEIYQKFLDMDDDERLSNAKSAASDVMDYLDEINVDEDNKFLFMINLYKLFASGDRSVGSAEHEFFQSLFNVEVEYKKFFDLVNYGSANDFVDGIDHIIDQFPSKAKAAVTLLGIAIMTCDGKLTVSEQELLEKLMN